MVNSNDFDSMDLLIGEAVNENSFDSVKNPLELYAILHDRIDLLGFYLAISHLINLGVLPFKKQEQLADILHLSKPTYIKFRNELIERKVLALVHHGNKLWTLKLLQISRIPLIKIPSREDAHSYLDSLQRKVHPLSEKEIVQISMDGIIKEEVKKEIVKSKEKEIEKKKQEEIRYPEEDYKIVLNGYKKYKGVGLIGPEIARAKKAIKEMFKASRSPKQIVDCMKFFKENQNDDENRWMRYWTLETIGKKIPEFLANSLTPVKKMGDDIEEVKVNKEDLKRYKDKFKGMYKS